MKLSLLHQPATSASTSPYRLVDQGLQEVPWANAFLDAQRIRQLSLRSLRAYGYDLLHFARWWLPRHPSRTVQEMDESALLDYVRDQLNEDPQPTPQTINHRLGVLRSLYLFHSGRPLAAGSHGFQRLYLTQSPLGYGRPRRMMATGLRLKEPHRVIVPLSTDEVAKFWRSFRTFRDLALVALMLLNGLRSQETLDLQLEDLQLAEAQLRVLGKGNKPRPLPLPGETIQVIQNYLHLERPVTNSSALFVSLKGPQRGLPMTLAGLRSLFRHHRGRSRVLQANPHRFRHTFGADMVRAGISLPALQQLMGHAHIRTTMLYVQIAPQDVWREYAPDYPHLQQLAELRRDPHLFGWFRRLCQKEPSLSNTTRQTYLFQLRRLFDDLACAGHPLQPGLILTEDLPPRPQYLPRALSLEDDQLLQQELRRRNDLLSNALLLMRATGLRIGECIGLAVNCLPSVGPDQWAVRVPLGKLRTERLVPVDEDVRQMVNHILVLRAQSPASQLAQSAQFLLPWSRPYSLYNNLRVALNQAAQRSGCSDHVTPHRLRHTYASEMIRLGVSLPSVMKLLGHKTIRMTLRYVQVTQRDLQREFHLARQNAVHVHQVPELSASTFLSASSDLPGILHALAAARHLLEMYRRQLKDDSATRTLRRLDKRLHTVAFELDRLAAAAK